MAHFSFDIVGFDLDGTLVDTSADIAAAVNFALGEAGRAALTVAQIESMIGGGAKHMFAQAMEATGGCEPEEFRRLYKVLLAHYADHIAVYSRPYPGAVAAIDKLRAMGVKTAIVTNKFEAMATRLLAELGIADRFDCLIGGDTLGPGKSKPDRAPIDAMIERCGGGRAAFVGDSLYDVEAAHNAGIPVIAVSFGFLHGPVEALGADAVIDSYAELIPTLEALATRAQR
jgi:phosphoglycolate phosphatase